MTVAIISRCAVVRRDSPRMISHMSSCRMPHRLGIETVQHRRADGRTALAPVAVPVDLFTLALFANFPVDILQFAVSFLLGDKS